jgi:hypothetical protein
MCSDQCKCKECKNFDGAELAKIRMEQSSSSGGSKPSGSTASSQVNKFEHACTRNHGTAKHDVLGGACGCTRRQEAWSKSKMNSLKGFRV